MVFFHRTGVNRDQQMVTPILSAGLRIVFGSHDAGGNRIHGWGSHMELEAFVDWVGMIPHEAIVAAPVTYHNGRLRTAGLELYTADLDDVGGAQKCGKKWCASCAPTRCLPSADRGPIRRPAPSSCSGWRPRSMAR